MPVAIVDTEQAELIVVALDMLEAALTARTRRVDPDEIITKALRLQALKLATVRTLLALPDPPTWGEMDPALRRKAENLLWLMHRSPDTAEASAAWEGLRGIINAPGFPAPAET